LLCKHYGILLLQFFYASAGLIGVVRWLWNAQLQSYYKVFLKGSVYVDIQQK
jgi:hypothetical protein